jgi:biopolymer transport protein ExbD
MVPKPPKPVSMELNLAPMVDVMMCLIIFFMLASTLVSAENLKEIKIPWAVSAKEVEKKEMGNRIVINVRPDAAGGPSGFVVAAPTTLPDGTFDIAQRELKPEEVGDFLKTQAVKAGDQLGEMRCIIRADENAKYSDVEVVLRGCGLAKIAHIVFSAHAGQEPGS